MRRTAPDARHDLSFEANERDHALARIVCDNPRIRKRIRELELAIDEEVGAAVRTCSKCKSEHPIGDSDEYLEEAELQACVCVCGKDMFELTVGVSLYEDSDDVRWLYVGCRCPSCGITGCYGEWKNEFIDYRKLLKRV